MNRGPRDPHKEWRTNCYGCFRPETHCVCKLISPFDAHCDILILQHPHERRKYYATAKLVTSAVRNSRLLRGVEFEPGVLEKTLADKVPYLLFPGADAQDCEQITLTPQNTVIVVDGTWSEAGKIVRRNPLLLRLPKVSFRRELTSNYKIRKQPRARYLSTVESVAHLLRLNAEAGGDGAAARRYESLLQGFDRMVDQQLSYFPRMRNGAVIAA